MPLRFGGRTGLVMVSTVVLIAVTGSPGSGVARPGPEQALRPGRGACGHLVEIVRPSGVVTCTHGADPAPEGVDPSQPFDPAKPRRAGLILPEPDASGGRTAAEATGPARARCYGDGVSGNRVQAIYARPANRPDRYALVVDSIRQWAAEMDEVFQASADKTGSIRHVRFVTDSVCQIDVDNVVLTSRGDDSFGLTITELVAQGFTRTDRKYLVWMDSTVLCGIAEYYVDEDPSQDNFNNGVAGVPGTISRIDSGCWGYASEGESIEGHELMHSLGAVLPGAPNSSPAGHCDDDADLMCYEDGSVLALRSVCPPQFDSVFDCGDDDYFNPKPPAGSYLASNWNSASSSFLSASDGIPRVTIGDVRVGEGDRGTTDAVFTVSLDTPSPDTVTVAYTTASGSGVAGQDYTVRGGTLSIPPGKTTAQIVVKITGDHDEEPDEAFTVDLSQPVRALLADDQGVGVIANDDRHRLGYWLVATDGGIFSFGDAPFYGSTGNVKLNRPVYGMASTPGGGGYWMVADDGGIFAFGDARFFGSTGDRALAHPIIGMATTPTGGGYWLAGAGGETFAFGDAPDLGSQPSPSAPIVGIAASWTGKGYWLVGQDGRVYARGNAGDFGSAVGPRHPVVGIAATPSGNGYWVATNGGQIFAFGDASNLGSTPPPTKPVVGIASSPSGRGYWMDASDGGIFAFGDAPFLGSTGAVRLNQPVVGMSPVG